MTQLLLIRHATNDIVKENRLAGRALNVHLNDEGRAQARALAERLASLPIAAIYSSPMERAVQTAAPLAQAKGLKIQIHDGLTELDIGDWSGGNIEQLSRTEVWQQFQMAPSLTRLPNGETGQEMQARALAALEAICAQHPQNTVAIFSHADVIKVLIAHYAGMHLDHFQRIVVSPASVSVVWVGHFGARLLGLNTTNRLEDLLPRQSESQEQAQKQEQTKGQQ